MSYILEDLLLEILIRLPSCRDAVRCRLVCRRWNSLISSPLFIQSFIRQQSLCSDSHLAMLLFQKSYSELSTNGAQFSKIFPEKSKTFREHCLNFLPWNVIVRAYFDDLLLVSQPRNFRDFCICNPLTKKWHALPQAPLGIQEFYIRCGLVCLPSNNCSSKHYRYNVVVFGFDFPYYLLMPPVVTIFCSETAQWSKLVDFWLPSPDLFFHQIAACNGILYSVASNEENGWGEGIVALNPFADVVEKQFRFISLPMDIDPTPPFDKFSYICVGTFQGRLRLSHLRKVNDSFGLKVWKLEDQNVGQTSSWSLVHNVVLAIGFPINEIYILALHPSNSNVVFLSWDDELLQYDISQGKYQKLGIYPVKQVAPRLFAFPLMHYSWPTPVPVPALPL
ncbi:hypothetical protein UlMin_004824 [Ulmus minor]